jgi:hypothetical protein
MGILIFFIVCGYLGQLIWWFITLFGDEFDSRRDALLNLIPLYPIIKKVNSIDNE